MCVCHGEAMDYNQMADSDVVVSDVSEGLGCVIGCDFCRESCNSEIGARS